jgi:hypothetical protein
MSSNSEFKLPEKTTGDQVHLGARAVISAIPLAGGPVLEIFNALVAPPIERRRNEWMESVVSALEELQKKDSLLVERLQQDQTFHSVLLQATWVAVRNHQEAKLQALRIAIQNAAVASNDAQLLFVRYVDELTPTHLVVMSFFAKHEEEVAGIAKFADLHAYFTKCEASEVDQMFFKLVCDDLNQRGLIRISSHLEDYPGLYDAINLVTEATKDLPYILVSEFGRQFVAFVLKAPWEENT